MKISFKNQIFASLFVVFALLSPAFATPNNLHIIPENQAGPEAKAQANQDVKYVGTIDGKTTVIERYNKRAGEISQEKNIGRAMQTGIMNRDTLLNYVQYLISFLGQLGLLIGGLMVLYAGYLYATTIFGAGSPSKAKTAIKNAVIGVIVIVSSYAIWKGLLSLFL